MSTIICSSLTPALSHEPAFGTSHLCQHQLKAQCLSVHCTVSLKASGTFIHVPYVADISRPYSTTTADSDASLPS